METTVGSRVGLGFRVWGLNGKGNGNYYNGLYRTAIRIHPFIPS